MINERKYQFLNNQAIAIINQWLITTGAIAGYKPSPVERIGFIANWEEAKKEPSIIEWWKTLRGTQRPLGVDDRKASETRFRWLISLLVDENPENGGIQYLLQNEFSSFVEEYRTALALAKIDTEEKQIQQRWKDRIAKENESGILEMIENYRFLKKRADDELTAIRVLCHNTYNNQLLRGI
jgi:hypothetical protein